MRNRKGWKHWLFTGLALLGCASNVHGQTVSPYYTGAAYGGAPAMAGGGMMGNHGPMSIAMPGPAPMDLAYADGPGAMYSHGSPAAFGSGCACCEGACDVSGGCDSLGGMGMGMGMGGMGMMPGGEGGGCAICGTYPCLLGAAPLRDMWRSTGLGARHLGSDGCYACGWGNNAILPGRFMRLLGRLAPYAEGPQSQRWFDAHVGTLALARTDDILGSVITTQGITGTPVLRTDAPDINNLEFGLLTTVALQTGPGSNLELTYFGLNRWRSTATVESGAADLFSVISGFGTNPPNGFDDTDRSISQSLTYDSAIHNAELNFRRRWVAPSRWVQGSWLAGVRYFDLDETFGYQTIGLINNGIALTPRFFNMDTQTRNQLTGFQVGGDTWLTIVPGWQIGSEGKFGVYGNHAEMDTTISSNSVPLAREARSDGETAYLSEFILSSVYRINYSWSFRASYNHLRVDNVALAPRNFNTAGLGNSPAGVVFGPARAPFIDVNGTAKFHGFSLGAEYLW